MNRYNMERNLWRDISVKVSPDPIKRIYNTEKYLLEECGIEMVADPDHPAGTYPYKIINEQKFTLFVLKWS